MATLTTARSSTPGRNRSPYRAVLRGPRVPTLLVGTLTGRLPAALAPTLVLLAQTRSGTSLALASLLSALQAMTAALSQPVLARAADRLGHRPVLTLTTGATTLVYVLLASQPASSTTLTAALIALSGLLAPPFQACLRARWPRLVPAHALGCAHALDSSLSQILYIAAPLLAASTVYGPGPATGYLLAAALGPIGAAILAAAPAVPGTDSAWARHPLGPLRSADLRWLMTAHAAIGASLGTVAVASVVTCTRAGHPAAAGLAPALYGTGALVGGLLFGARHWPGTLANRFLATMGLMTLAWVPAAVSTGPWTAALAAALPGAALTPTLTSGSDLRSARVPNGHAEASGWVIAALGSGEVAGVVLAGHWPSTWWPFLYGTAALATSSLWLLGGAKTRTPKARKDTRAGQPGPDGRWSSAGGAVLLELVELGEEPGLIE